MSTNNGGQAFPTLEHGGNGLELSDPGMTLRDYFAGKAMQGFAADPTCGFQDGIPGMARLAYEWADAMLKAREAQ